MSRITGSEVKSLMEAYNEIYTSQEQEITEEQIWEEVENWVNSLLEEGYDLSEYTWEEMYESYIAEEPLSAFSGLKADLAKKGLEKRVSSYLKGQTPSTSTKPAAKPSSASLSAFSGLKADLARKGLERRVGGFLKGEKPATTAPKPAAPAARPAAPAATPAARPVAAAPKVAPKVAPSKPAAPTPGTKAAGPESIKPKTPNPLLAGGEIRRMQQASQMRQKGIDVTSSQLAAAERTKPSTLKQSYEHDAFDLVLEYLINNGHVDTIDEALYVMMEMDAQTIGDIVEETLQEKLKPGTRGKISFGTGKDDKFNQAMTETNPRTGRQRGTSPELKAMGAHGRAKSAQYDAENRGDTEAARRHETRRGKIAHTVYRKTGRIIDRADND